jgi:thiol-disulfide isomerase/thioredoxin
MNYRLALLITGAFFIASNLMAGGGYKIKFTFKQLDKGTIKLAYYYGDKQYVKDTAVVDKTGKVEFSGKEDLPSGIYLVVLPSTKYFEVLIDKEQKFSFDVDTTDLVNGIKITGSKDNQDFYQYLSEINKTQKQAEALKRQLDAETNDSEKEKIKKQLSDLEKEYKNIKTRFIEQHPEAFLSKVFKAAYEPEIPEAPLLPNGKKDSTFAYRYFKAHYFDNVDMKDERLIRTPVLSNKVKTYIEKLTPQIPDSINKAADYLIGLSDGKNELFKWLVFWITNTYEKSNVMGMDAVFVHMAKQYYLSGKAYWIDTSQQNKIRKRVEDLEPNLIGKKAVNLKLLKPDFHQIQINDLKSTYSILYFWDPSCGHCQKVTPKLYEFYQAHKKEFDLEILAIYTETDTTEWFKYIREKKLDWINAADLLWNTNYKKYYDIYSTPVIYVLDRQKKIIAKRIDVEQLPDFIRNHKKFEATKPQ